MSPEVYWFATTDDQARETVEKIKATGIHPDAVAVAAKPAEMDGAAHRVSQKSRNALNGAILGSIIGMLFGCAVLITIGFEASPGLFEAMLLVACSALGGGIFGAIVGSTGIFAAERITPALKRHFEAEIGHGRTVIFVRLKNIAQRDRLMTALNGWDDTDIHYSGNQAA